MDPKFRASITKEEVNDLPIGNFGGTIVVVDTFEAVAEACDYLMSQTIIGFDTETRPTFAKGATNKVALLQLSSDESAFLFRINKIALEKPILKLMECSSVIKVGAAIKDDIKALQALRRFTPKGFIDLQSIVNQYGINELSIKKLAAITMNIKVSKAQRLSNWEANTLTSAQQLYAATDAWVGRSIYIKLTEK